MCPRRRRTSPTRGISSNHTRRSCGWYEGAGVSSPAPRPSSALRALDDQFVLDTEGALDLTRAQTGDRLVGLAVHDAEQGDCSALHDDMKGIVAKRLHPWETPKTHGVKAVAERMPMAPQHPSARRVPRQERVAVDFVIRLPPQFIVVLRNRQFLNIVNDLIDAGRALRRPRRIRFQRPVITITHQRDRLLVVAERT